MLATAQTIPASTELAPQVGDQFLVAGVDLDLQVIGIFADDLFKIESEEGEEFRITFPEAPCRGSKWIPKDILADAVSQTCLPLL
jgi:hypothetical protein